MKITGKIIFTGKSHLSTVIPIGLLANLAGGSWGDNNQWLDAEVWADS